MGCMLAPYRASSIWDIYSVASLSYMVSERHHRKDMRVIFSHIAPHLSDLSRKPDISDRFCKIVSEIPPQNTVSTFLLTSVWLAFCDALTFYHFSLLINFRHYLMRGAWHCLDTSLTSHLILILALLTSDILFENWSAKFKISLCLLAFLYALCASWPSSWHRFSLKMPFATLTFWSLFLHILIIWHAPNISADIFLTNFWRHLFSSLSLTSWSDRQTEILAWG